MNQITKFDGEAQEVWNCSWQELMGDAILTHEFRVSMDQYFPAAMMAPNIINVLSSNGRVVLRNDQKFRIQNRKRGIDLVRTVAGWLTPNVAKMV